MGYGVDHYLRDYFIPGTPSKAFSIDAYCRPVFVSVSSATTFYQSLSGILSAIGTAVKYSFSKRSGAFSFSGAAKKQTSVNRAGAFSFSGAAKKLTLVARYGAFAFSGAVARAKLSVKALAGILAFAGLAAKYSQLRRAGTLAATGTARKYSQVRRTGGFGFTGLARKTTQVARAGILAFSGAASKYARVLRSGALAFSGLVGRAKLSVKALAGVLDFAGSVAGLKIAAFLVAVGGVLSFSGSAGKFTKKLFQGALDFGGYLLHLFTGFPPSTVSLVTPAEERIAIDGRAVAAFALATTAEDSPEYLTPAEEAVYLQCQPTGGPIW